MATIIWKRSRKEADIRAAHISEHGIDIRMRGTVVRITHGNARVLAISELLQKDSRRLDIGLCTILLDPYNLIPVAHGELLQDCGRYFDSCQRGCAIPAHSDHLSTYIDGNPLARFIRAQMTIHASEIALVFPREIMRIGVIGNDYYITHVPPPARIIAQHLATRRRLRMTDYVVGISHTYNPTPAQVSRAFIELFSDIGEVPSDIDMTMTAVTRGHRVTPAKAATASPGSPRDDDDDDDDDGDDAPIIAKEYEEYDG